MVSMGLECSGRELTGRIRACSLFPSNCGFEQEAQAQIASQMLSAVDSFAEHSGTVVFFYVQHSSRC